MRFMLDLSFRLALAGTALTLIGCSAVPEHAVPSPPLPKPATRQIVDSADYAAPACQRHTPSVDGRRAFLGVRVNTCTSQQDGTGAYVVGFFLLDGYSPAVQAGIRVGDRIISVKGCRVSNAGEMRIQLEETAPGSTVFVQLRRQGAAQPSSVPIRTISWVPAGGDAAGRMPGPNLCRTIGLAN